jgi:rhodanese-related sulfurtransferase
MKKTILSLSLLCSTLVAEVTNIEVTPEFIEKNKIKIIDIRTENEWEEMGIIPSVYLMTFFTENNEFHGKSFLKELNKVVEKDEQFAIISNTASRTKLVSNFLGHKHNYNVINLLGGMTELLKKGYKVEIYNPKAQKKKTPITQKIENEEVEEVEPEDTNSSTK